jgi:hypothetical protein
MTPRRLARPVAGLALALGLVLGACGEDLVVTPVRNLERPSDMDFVCLAAEKNPEGELVATGRPMTDCYVASMQPGGDAGIGSQVAVGSRITFGLFTNTARSEVGAIDLLPADQGGDRLVDLDRRQPGFNMVPVGTLPERIAASDDGCTSVTANRGSCDLSVIDNTRMLAGVIGAVPSSGAGEIVRRLRIRTGDGQPFWAMPAEVAIVPKEPQPPLGPTPAPPADGGTGSTDALADGPADDAPASDATPGDVSPADAGTAPEAATGARQVAGMCSAEAPGALGLHQAVVTFPGCDLVALIDLNTGSILSSARMRADGSLEDTGPNPVCSAECTGGGPPADAAPAADGGAGGGSSRLGLSALALNPEDDLVYVGANRSPVIGVLKVSDKQLQPQPGYFPLPLAENAGGVTRLRLSRDPYRVVEGRHFVGPKGSFLYAFAQDGSVRVVSLGDRRECDVNVDVEPGSQGVDPNPCYPIGAYPRNVLARGPGLRPPASDPSVGPPLPVDIAFTTVNGGGTGFLLTSRGDVYHVGLGYHTPTPIEFIHGIRRDAIAGGGTAMAVTTPSRNFSDTLVAFPTRVAFNTADTGPFLQPIIPPKESTGDTTFLFFPGPTTRRDKVPRGPVVLAWEGVLPFTQRASGKVSTAGQAGRNAGTLTDEAASFCSAGVEPGDVLAMVGCDEDRQCDPLRNEVCYRAAPGAQGTCLPRSLVDDENWARLCQSELGSRRRYEVKTVSRGQIELLLKPDEVPRPDVSPCSPRVDNDTVCQPDAAHRPDPNLRGDRGFQCVQLADDTPRCLKPCGVQPTPGAAWQPNNDLCRAGYVCADLGNTVVGPVCVEGPPPRPECTPGDARYQIQAGRGYTVASRGLPFFSRMRERKGGACELNPDRSPLLVSRIPLSAPTCTSIPPEVKAQDALTIHYDPIKEAAAGNPCLFRPSDRPGTISAAYENAHFRLVLNNVDTYIGDAAEIAARIDTGYVPVTVTPSRQSEMPNLPVRIVTGPMSASTREKDKYDPPPPYVFVVDQSRTTSLLSRGKIMRINPYHYQYGPGGHFDSLLTGTLFPIQ